jgi:molecular chaperone GrpE (heat shock protein)
MCDLAVCTLKVQKKQMNGGITMGNQENVVQMDFEDESNTDEENLLEIVLNTREQCQMMQQLIENQIKVKDEMIDKLHKELEYYKNSAADKFAEQLMKAVIKVHKDMNRLVNSDKWDSMTADDLKREYTYARDDVADLLEQQNVDAFNSAPGGTPLTHPFIRQRLKQRQKRHLIKQSKAVFLTDIRKVTRFLFHSRESYFISI